MASVDGTRTVDRDSDECFMFECDLCKYQDAVKKASAYCVVCAEYLCQTCEQAHRRSRASRDHELLTGSKLITAVKPKLKLPIAYCKDHSTMELTMYCENHLSLVCDICNTTRHRKCKTTSLGDKIGPMKRNADFDKAVNECKKLKERFSKLQTKRKEAVNKIKIDVSTCLSDMRALRKNVNELFDELEQDMANEIADVEKAMTSEISNQVLAIGDIVKQTEESLKALNECSNIRDESLMFIGMKKSMDILNENEQIIKDIEKEITPVSITFEPTEVISEVLLGLKTIGTLKHSLQTESKVGKSLLDVDISFCRDIDVKSTWITGCTFMPNGELVVCDREKHTIKVFDNEFIANREINVSDQPWDVAVVDNTKVICSLVERKALQFVTITPFIVIGKILPMSRICRGVHVHNNMIYTSCHNNPGDGEIQILDMEGRILNRLGNSHGKYMFTRPSYVSVNGRGDRVYVSDTHTNSVTCVSIQGQVLYQYKDSDLCIPMGMIVDGDDNVLVCGNSSRNVHVISKDGTKHKVLLLNIRYSPPSCIAYRGKDGALVVGMDTSLENTRIAKVFMTQSLVKQNSFK